MDKPSLFAKSVLGTSLDAPESSAQENMADRVSPNTKRLAENYVRETDMSKKRKIPMDSQNNPVEAAAPSPILVPSGNTDALGQPTNEENAKSFPDTSTDSENVNLSITTDFRNILKANVNNSHLSDITINESISGATFNSLGPFYDLPVEVKTMFKNYRGIESLFDWQHACLSLPQIQAGENLIYTLPTSGGKTLVAEILTIRELLCNKKNVLFILPFVSMVQEKVWAMSQFAIDLNFIIEEYAGSIGVYPPRKRSTKNVIYFATIEKSSNLVNSLIGERRLNELGLVVIDELHLIGEARRGNILESLITKLIYMEANIQIVGMSATIGNIEELAAFMHAGIFTRDFRPVKLTEYVQCGLHIGEVNYLPAPGQQWLIRKRIQYFGYSGAFAAVDPDRIGGLVLEVIPQKSCLIFCESKSNCENVTKMLCKVLPKRLTEHKSSEKMRLIQELELESGAGGLDQNLRSSIKFGIAYHHAGLIPDERRLIQEGFIARTLCVICCTSTLAAGVNLPAERVIVRSPYIGLDFINISRYKQMVGRAGRTGLDKKGESILVVNQKDFTKAKNMLLSPMDKVKSRLHLNNYFGLRELVLSCISLGLTKNRRQLSDMINLTFMARQKEQLKVLEPMTENVLNDLIKLGVIEFKKAEEEKIGEPLTNFAPQNTIVVVTALGQAYFQGGLDLSESHLLSCDLEVAQKCLNSLDELYLLYLVTPYKIAENLNPRLEIYSIVLDKLNSTEIPTARILGFTEAAVRRLLCGLPVKSISKTVFNRFYLTLILNDLLNGEEVNPVATKFDVSRGMVKGLVNNTASFASNVANFCDQLEKFSIFSNMFAGPRKRLNDCFIKYFSPLMELPSMKEGVAKQLFIAGFRTIHSISKANADDLLSKIEFMSRRVASQLIEASKVILLKQTENLQEADASS